MNNLVDLIKVIAAYDKRVLFPRFLESVGVTPKNYDIDKKIEEYILALVEWLEITSVTPLNINGYCDFRYTENAHVKIQSLESVLVNNDTYYVFDYCGHNSEWQINEYSNIKDVETYLLSPGGVTNMFTTKVIVYHNGGIQEFDIVESKVHWKE